MNLDWEKARDVIALYEKRILAIPDVVGISTGIDRKSGSPKVCIRIFSARPVARGELDKNKIPDQLEEIPVELVVSGEMKAMDDSE